MTRWTRILVIAATVSATVAATVATLSLAPTSAGAAAPRTASAQATVPSALSNRLPLERLVFSRPVLAAELPALALTPALPTAWRQIAPNAVQAVATEVLAPGVTYRVPTPSGVTCTTRCTFTGVRTTSVAVATDLVWEDQLLAQLGYLPVTFTPAAPQATPSAAVAGVFTWAYPALPSALRAQWAVGSDNVVLQGALMSFQLQSGLPTTGQADPATWAALVQAANANTTDPNPYDYVYVSMALPETLTLYVGGRATFHTLVNTGIPVSPTAPGTYPVYLRYLSQTMSGTNPNGSHYSDPGIPDVSYFHGGDALHGFIRASYGFPQSLGCVEMPFAAAKTLYPHTPIGTLVTVAS
ncbi:MAG TPA: L,D-transpeptidase family protein [Acidimicrobiales bacterium]|nr:L,D-transpeptidase family protein [Acidimicrobiales bacterium]